MNERVSEWLLEATLHGMKSNRKAYRAALKTEREFVAKLRRYAAKGSTRAAETLKEFLATYPELESEPRREPLTAEERRVRRNRRKAGK